MHNTGGGACVITGDVLGASVMYDTGWPLQDIVLLRSFCARINHSFIAHSHLHCPHYCNAIARLLRNIRRPPDPPFVCHAHYHIGNGNIV